jgi:hypothetical protein
VECADGFFTDGQSAPRRRVIGRKFDRQMRRFKRLDALPLTKREVDVAQDIDDVRRRLPVRSDSDAQKIAECLRL